VPAVPQGPSATARAWNGHPGFRVREKASDSVDGRPAPPTSAATAHSGSKSVDDSDRISPLIPINFRCLSFKQTHGEARLPDRGAVVRSRRERNDQTRLRSRRLDVRNRPLKSEDRRHAPDPLLPVDPSISTSENRHSKRALGRSALPCFDKRHVIRRQLKAILRDPASITQGLAARDIAVLQVP